MPGRLEEYAEMLNRRTAWRYGRLGAAWGPGAKNGDACGRQSPKKQKGWLKRGPASPRGVQAPKARPVQKQTAEPRSAVVRERKGLLGLCLHDIVANRVANQFADGMAVEAPHDIGAVRLGGFDAEIQGRRDFLAALAFRQELDDLALARG